MTSMYGRAPEPQPGFFDRLGDPNSQLNAMVMGLGGGLLRYGEPSVGEKSFGGGFGAGINGMLNGVLAQKQAAEEEKRQGLLDEMLSRMYGKQNDIADAAGQAAGMPPMTNMLPDQGPPVQTQMPPPQAGPMQQPPIPMARPPMPQGMGRPGMGMLNQGMGQPTPEEEILLGLLDQKGMMPPRLGGGPF